MAVLSSSKPVTGRDSFLYTPPSPKWLILNRVVNSSIPYYTIPFYTLQLNKFSIMGYLFLH